MLTLINLQIIDQILNVDAEVKLSPMAKMLYINCLTHHFKGKGKTVASAVAFELFINDINGYNKFERQFQELHKAGLVAIGSDRVSFNNTWGKYIDRTQLDKVSADAFVGGVQITTPEQFKPELLGSETMFEMVAMKYNVTRRQTEMLIDLFVKEQTAFGKQYTGFADCIKHFTYWIPHNKDKAPRESVKSTGKLLGED